ncbi:hypothetical protein D3C77_732210 [compost metagenome]
MRVIMSLRMLIQLSKSWVQARTLKSSVLAPKPMNSTVGAGSVTTPGVSRATASSTSIARLGSVP